MNNQFGQANFKNFKHRSTVNKKTDPSGSRPGFIANVDYKLYICPNCSNHYECFQQNNQFNGRVPLVLTACKHTVCKTCIYNSLISDYVTCPVCTKPSPVKKTITDVCEVFEPNFYLLGLIWWSKSNSFTSSQKFTLRPTTRNKNPPQEADKTMDSVELKKCSEHVDMYLEFFCITCDVSACCYCMLVSHEGHKRYSMLELTEKEIEEIPKLKERASEILKILKHSLKRAETIASTSANTSSIETEISDCFANLHASLYFIEKKLRADLNSLNTKKGVKGICSLIDMSMNEIKQILTAVNSVESANKINRKELLRKLRHVENTPCYLICRKNPSDRFAFSVGTAVDELENCFEIDKVSEDNCILVPINDIPVNCDSESRENSDSDTTQNSTSSHKYPIRSPERPKSTSSSHRSKKMTTPSEKVTVTHIKSLECFYVQLKKQSYKIYQLNGDIKQFANVNALQIESPCLNELYLVLYEYKKEKQWCRGRITEIRNGETGPLYEVFFIDYGYTQCVNISRIKEIPPFLENNKPFAIECRLHNPSNNTWGKNSHIQMGKIIMGKEVLMIEKKDDLPKEVDLLVASSDGGVTSVFDILVHSCNALSSSEDNCSVKSVKMGVSNKTKVFPNSKCLEKHQSIQVTLAYVLNPDHIFIQLAENAEHVQKLCSDLKRCYRSIKSGCIPVEGSYVLVENRDRIRGNYHRALVKDVDANTGQANLFLVDWGLNVVVPWTKIRKLPENVTKVEAQAILVKLADVIPPNELTAWTVDVNKFLQKYVQQQVKLKMTVQSKHPLEVALFEMYTTIDICINALLVEEKLASSAGKISTAIEWPQMQVEKKEYSEDDAGLVAKMLNKLDESEDEEDELLETCLKQSVTISKLESPDLIYIKFVKQTQKENQLCKELQIHYTNEREEKTSWTVSDKCVVHHPVLNRYVRGIIKEKIDETHYKVDLFDEPDELVVEQNTIFNYMPYFSEYPNMVFKCHLANIKPAGDTGKWSRSSIEALEQVFMMNTDLYVTKVIGGDTSSKSIPVEMWCKETCDVGPLKPFVVKYKSVNKMLVKLGLAFWVDMKKFVRPTESNKTVHENTNKKVITTKALEDTATPQLATEKLDSVKETKQVSIADWLPPFPINKLNFNAWITCALPEGILFLHDEDLDRPYKEMEKSMKNHFDSNPPTNENNNWSVGQMCTIAYKDYWYRGKIIEINKPNEIEVVMIDFGSEHVLSPEHLYREIMFPTLPAFASMVKLHGLFPKSGQWLSSDYEAFMRIISEHVKIIVKSDLGSDLTLVDCYTDKGVYINKKLAEMCSNLIRENITIQTEQNSENEDEDVVLIDEEPIDPRSTGLEDHKLDIKNIEDKVENQINDDSTEEVINEKEEKKNIEIDLSKSHESDKDEVELTCYKMEPLPKESFNHKIEVSVVGVISYKYVVFTLPSMAESLVVDLFALTDSIQQGVQDQPLLTNINIGQPCICPYSEDNIWYRAQIHNIDELDSGRVFVFFVDYGNIQSVSITDVKQMKPEWFKMPVLCYTGELNIEMISDDHLEHVFQQIKKFYGHNKFMKITTLSPKLSLDLYEDDDTLSYQSMIDKGLINMTINE